MENKVNINMEIDKQIAIGEYSNIQGVSYTGNEVVVDFGKLIPSSKDGKIFSRILIHPRNAKLLMKNLEGLIEQIEKNEGEIKTGNDEKKNVVGFAPKVEVKDE